MDVGAAEHGDEQPVAAGGVESQEWQIAVCVVVADRLPGEFNSRVRREDVGIDPNCRVSCMQFCTKAQALLPVLPQLLRGTRQADEVHVQQDELGSSIMHEIARLVAL